MSKNKRRVARELVKLAKDLVSRGRIITNRERKKELSRASKIVSSMLKKYGADRTGFVEVSPEKAVRVNWNGRTGRIKYENLENRDGEWVSWGSGDLPITIKDRNCTSGECVLNEDWEDDFEMLLKYGDF